MNKLKWFFSGFCNLAFCKSTSYTLFIQDPSLPNTYCTFKFSQRLSSQHQDLSHIFFTLYPLEEQSPKPTAAWDANPAMYHPLNSLNSLSLPWSLIEEIKIGILPKGERSIAPMACFPHHSPPRTLGSSCPNWKLPECHAILYLCFLSFVLLPLSLSLGWLFYPVIWLYILQEQT